MIANEEFIDALKVLSDKEVRKYFDDKLKIIYETIGQLTDKELTLLQERVNVIKEMREQFISIRNQKTKTE